MIRAEVIEHPGVEVPNWVNKCKAVLTNGPVAVVMALAVVAVFGIIVWNGKHASFSNSTNVQSQPASGASLTVTTADKLPAQAVVSSTSATADTAVDPSGTASAKQSVGPAPASSLSNLQPTGNTSQNVVSGLTQAPLQTVQSAGKATLDSLQKLGL